MQWGESGAPSIPCSDQRCAPIRDVRLSAVLNDGTTISAGRSFDPSGRPQPFLTFTPPSGHPTEPLRELGPELATARVLLEELRAALAWDDDVHEALNHLERAATRHGEIVHLWSSGALGGTAGDEVGAAHASKLLALTEELKGLHHLVSASSDSDGVHDSIMKLAAAAEAQSARAADHASPRTDHSAGADRGKRESAVLQAGLSQRQADPNGRGA